MEQNQSKPIFKFKAGKMEFDENNKKVHGIKKRGTVYIERYEDQLLSISWKDDKKSNIEEDDQVVVYDGAFCFDLSKQREKVFILFNKEAEDQNPEPQKFYWSQEESNTKDKYIVKKVNEILNDISKYFEEENDEDYEDIDEEEENNQNNNLMDQESYDDEQNNENQGLLQQNNQNTNNFANLLSGFQNNPMFQQLLQQQQQQQQMKKEAPFLTEVFSDKKFLEEIAEDKDFQEALIKELPEGQQSKEHLLQNLKSPQFQQSLQSLDKALNGGEGSSVLLSLGLDAESFQQTLDGNKALYEAVHRQNQKK